MPIADEGVARLWPLGSAHINMIGRYTFALPETIARGAFRPLTDRADEADER